MADQTRTKIPAAQALAYVIREVSPGSGLYELVVSNSFEAGKDYDRIDVTLSSADTVETYEWSLASVIKKTLTITYTDNTRQTPVSFVWS